MNNEWIKWEWTEEKTYPETLETRVHVRLGNGYESTHRPWTVKGWGGGTYDSNFCPLDATNSELITHYRLA